MLGSGFDAVAAIAVIDGVEVHEKNLVFRVDLLEFDGEIDFAHLALDRDVGHLVGDDGVAHILLRNSGGSSWPPARFTKRARTMPCRSTPLCS